MMTILARRCVIIGLTFALFAVGLLALVENNRRPVHIGQFNLTSSCTQQVGAECKVRI